MLSLSEIHFGSNDAINYRNNNRTKDMFNSIFVKDEKLDRLMLEDKYFLVGEKGTGKTAYATFLENNEYQGTLSKVVEIGSTDYSIFMKLKKMELIQLSDYTKIWKIIILMIMASSIQKKEIASFGPRRSQKFCELQDGIEDYYEKAFIPEIANTFRYILDSVDILEAQAKTEILNSTLLAKSSSSKKASNEANIKKFQNSLSALDQKFSDAFARLKISKNRFLFLDSIDINLSDFESKDYEICLKGLANAVWDVNTRVFKTMAIEGGYLKVVLSIRPDIFANLNLHNQANKIRDNSVLLDWRTTYENYRTSSLFKLCNRLLAYNNPGLPEDDYWDFYFPWKTIYQTKRYDDDSFINCLRLSLSRPRDAISIMKAIQAACIRDGKKEISSLRHFQDNDTQNEISNYYIDEARDWCLYKFGGKGFETLMFFFQFLQGNSRFTYEEFLNVFEKYQKQVADRNMEIIEEILNHDEFLQLIYDLNMICYFDKDFRDLPLIRFCYREREIYNLTPKIKTGAIYGVHHALLKALNLGKNPIFEIEKSSSKNEEDEPA